MVVGDAPACPGAPRYSLSRLAERAAAAVVRDGLDVLQDRSRPRPCGWTRPSPIDTAHAGLRGEGNEGGAEARHIPTRGGAYFSFASTTIGATLPGVSSASEASCAASARSCSVTPLTGRNEGRGLAVAERDRARLVEQQRVDVAGCLDGAAGHGEHIQAHQAVHAGDADGRQQTRRWWSGSASRRAARSRTDDGGSRHRIGREARDRHRGENEDTIVMPASRMLSAISLGVF